MPKTSYLQSILCHFCIMDIGLLRYYLKDKYTYQEATKEVFLDKIERIFEEFRKAGDTELWLYGGICVGETCPNCGKKGYRFVGNHSKNYIDLLFEMEGDDIKDIVCCEEFETTDEINDLGTKTSIYINLDDHVRFHKNPEYWAKVYSATAAYSEMITTPAKLIDFEELCYWIDKHVDLNERIGTFKLFKPRMRWSPFSSLYAELREIRSYISTHLKEFIQANNSLEQIVTEQTLIDWLLKYEAIYEEACLDLKYVFVKDGESYISENLNSVNYTGEQFNQTFNFINSYQVHNEKLLKKYNTYTQEEDMEAFDKHDSQSEEVDFFSLRFHLEKRKALEEIGINIPFYINQEIK